MIDVSGQSVTDHQAGESFKKLREPAHLYGVAGSDLDVCINFLKLVKVHAETAGPRCTLYCTELEYHLKIYDGLVERSFLLPNDCYFPYSRDFKSRVKTYLEPTVKLKFLKMIGLHFSHGYRLAISHNQQRVEVSIDGTNQDDSIEMARRDSEIITSFVKTLFALPARKKSQYHIQFTKLEKLRNSHMKILKLMDEETRRVRTPEFIKDVKYHLLGNLGPIVYITFVAAFNIHFELRYNLVLLHNCQRYELVIDLRTRQALGPKLDPLKLSPLEKVVCILYYEERTISVLEKDCNLQ
ncbi:uncharacterized protein LOC111270578 [Varroa jacobsoni]|uniref:uncharacterized protein LOC111270578 n=1 Tax=Varroa jacobsoni TaxID=62625 RepID=UPI000BF557A9|nr:uncharacterized protein LOC111270578 [Varroa jacobsoni]